MKKIIMLGTGHGSVQKSYNTCFLIENKQDRLLVDTGGSICLSAGELGLIPRQ